MSQIEVLKEQARRHEQKEEWRKALELYQKAIARLAEEDAPDIGLHNRVGDLFIRVGEVDQAVVSLEQAIELYVEAELPNNAIAVCKKVLRNVPNRHETFLRMGQIRAQQGFLVDARTHFLTYAERMQVAGQLDEALRALVEFADAAPDDTEIRLSIAAHFQQHERTDEAVEQLLEGYRSAVRQDLSEVAEVFRARLEELRPGIDPDELLSATAAEDEGFVVETTALVEGEELLEFDDASEAVGELGHLEVMEIDEGPDSPDEAEALLAEALTSLEAPDEVFDVVGSDDDDDFTMLPGLDDVPADDVAEAIEDAIGEADLPVDPVDVAGGAMESLDDAISAIGPDVSHLGRTRDEHNPLEGFEVTADGVVGIDAADEDDVMEFDALDEDDEDVPLPLQTFHEPGDDTELPLLDDVSGDTEPPLLDHESDDSVLPSFDHESDDSEVALFDDESDDSEVALFDDESDDADLPFLAGTAPEDAPEAPGPEASSGAPARPAPPFSPPEPTVATTESDDLDALQRLVETAHRSGDDRVLADAYVALGGALRRSGEEARAQAVFRQALQAVPEHPGARAGLDSAPSAEREVAEVASNEDYVDLGALILGESDEKTTRFVVAYEEPSGDEQADFAKMLSQFKAKVAENVDASDVKAHHDLGTAYKEMGLLDEAVEEFQAALRASSDHLPTYEMLGQTFLDKGTPETAVRVLTRALDSPYEVEDELLGIYYYLGRAHELAGNKEQAREFYERVFSLDINFVDVTERLRALR